MWIIIAGTVIASMISSALLISALAVGKRGDEWVDETVDQPAPTARTPRMNKPATHAGTR